MQYEIVFRKGQFERRVFDRRGDRPSYAHFDLCALDQPHTIAPNRSHAQEVKAAYIAWAERFAASGLATVGQVVIKPVPVDEVERRHINILARAAAKGAEP